MNLQNLNAWADLLLDTGKRNNLINFRDSKSSAVEILSPNYATLFNQIGHASVFEVFDPKLEDEEEEFLFIDDDEGEEKHIPKDMYLAAYEKKLKKRQMLVYNYANKPIAAIKNISKKAKTAIEETGVNIVYMAFGFVHWTDGENGQSPMRAPILLVPISIENESLVEPYHIKITDDEVIVNPTFAFKLQNEYGIKLPEYNEDEGIEAYFASIEEIVSKLHWTVSTECKIGVFSFLKLNMYKDLKENVERITKNQNVKALLGDADARMGLGSASRASRDGVPAELHNVVDADSSQAEAIEMALGGESFVLQGPPGTGKSQTITNIIAECLYADKTVLFVSEKLAALNVVYEKLKNVGLEEFCLELHSHKASKKQVIDELCATLKLPKISVAEQAEREIRLKNEAKKRLDEYVSELHKKQPIIEKSLFQLYEEATELNKYPEIEFVVPNIESKGREYLEDTEELLVRYVEYVSLVGQDYRQNSWYGCKDTKYSYQALMQMKADLKAMIEQSHAFDELSLELKEKYEIDADNFIKLKKCISALGVIRKSGFISPALLACEQVDEVTDVVKSMNELSKKARVQGASLEESFDTELYELDGREIYKKLTREYSGFFSRLFGGEYKKIKKSVRLCKKDGKGLKYDQLVATAKKLSEYQEKIEKFEGMNTQVCHLLGEKYSGIKTNFVECVTELQELSRAKADGAFFGNVSEMSREDFAKEQASFDVLYGKLNSAWTCVEDSKNRIKEHFDTGIFNVDEERFGAVAEKLEACNKNVDRLDSWCEFNRFMEQVESAGLIDYVTFVIDNGVETGKIVPLFKKAFYTQWIDFVFQGSPILTELSRASHDNAVKQFKEKDKLNFEINKAMINAKLSENRPSLDLVAQGSSVATLLREGEKKRKQKSIRTLLGEITDLVQALKPCMLMSPLSVSAYLGPEMEFDVVIFDEASQIFPQDAIGAIYRGKQIIVVGDSKQMPPSNFFKSSTESDLDDEEDISDFESILDVCSFTFPQRRLKWHYRSRYEPLIAFSNKNFYDNDLVTFPSVVEDKEGIGVDYVYVDGVFDRKTKTNFEEAQRVVDLVFEHIDKYPDRSLGVVAFSISQQALIDKLISKRRKMNPENDTFFRTDKTEPFFVKNLETVQGDERDTIIFSVAYAKDSSGKLIANFGPINREGGERRLNVAVTRAKHNVKLVSSMHFTDINMLGAKSVGARMLCQYLEYAENGPYADKENESANAFVVERSSIEGEISDFLRGQGYVVDTRVGCSSSKIGLAVKKPDGENYALAIEIDGSGYSSFKSARDRDRLRQEVLERMGWNYYRIWSTDWFRNKIAEKQRLLAAVEDALGEGAAKEAESKDCASFLVEDTDGIAFDFPTYECADIKKIEAECGFDIPAIVMRILEVEAPLSEEWLLKRIVHLFFREKVTSIVRAEFESKMAGVDVIRRDGFMYLKNREIPGLRVPDKNSDVIRDVKHIALEELAMGMTEILKRNIRVEKNGLFHFLAQKLGFTRTGDAIFERFEEVLESMSQYVVVSDGAVSLK